MIRLVYKLLNRANEQLSQIFREVQCLEEELHVRKLVDASLMGGILYEHTSNALEEVEVVYMEPLQQHVALPKHPQKVYGFTVEYYEYVQGNLKLVQSKSFPNFSSLLTRLLDHYTVIEEKDYELTYSVLDEDRGCVLIYLKPE